MAENFRTILQGATTRIRLPTIPWSTRQVDAKPPGQNIQTLRNSLHAMEPNWVHRFEPGYQTNRLAMATRVSEQLTDSWLEDDTLYTQLSPREHHKVLGSLAALIANPDDPTPVAESPHTKKVIAYLSGLKKNRIVLNKEMFDRIQSAQSQDNASLSPDQQDTNDQAIYEDSLGKYFRESSDFSDPGSPRLKELLTNLQTMEGFYFLKPPKKKEEDDVPTLLTNIVFTRKEVAIQD